MKKILVVILLSIFLSSFSLADTFKLATSLEKGSSDYERINRTLSEIFKRAGNHSIELVPLPPERALTEANKGSLDGDSARAKGGEKGYDNLISSTESITSIDVSAYTVNPSITSLKKEELKNYTIIYVLGSKAIENGLLPLADKSKINPTAKLENAFKMLTIKRADLLLSIDSMAVDYLKLPENKSIKKITPPLLSIPVHIILNKKHTALIPKIDKVILEMKKDGTLKNLVEE